MSLTKTGKIRKKQKTGKNRTNDLERCKQHIITRVKGMARIRGRDFNITVNDIDWPTHCPIFGTELDYFFAKKSIMDVPSLDRIDTSKGYVKGNVAVISNRANTRKGEMTKDHIERLLAYVSQAA